MVESISPNYREYFDIDKIVADIRSYLPNFNEGLFREAFEYAEKAHRGQFRKDGNTPYIVHPVETVKSLIEFHADQDTLISGLLHDVPEDTGIDSKEIKDKFGETVHFLVEGITKLSKVHYQDNMSGRQIESLRKLLIHSAKDLRIILIKLADRLHNMKTLEFVRPDKRARIAKETLEIYLPIASLLGIYRFKKPMEDLCFKYLFPTEYERIKEKYEQISKSYSHDAETFTVDISEKLKLNKVKAEIVPKQRGMYREYKKLCARGKTIDDLIDNISIGIIVDNAPDCYKTLGVIHESYTPMPNSFRDHISKPKINGYKALHTTIFGVNGTLTNIQIQSRDMYIEGQYGIAAPFFLVNGKKDKIHNWSGEKYLWLNNVIKIGSVDKMS
ncbi:MAG: HD domain-containing protein, partial [Candidatus Gracilibacteria bacterium]